MKLPRINRDIEAEWILLARMPRQYCRERLVGLLRAACLAIEIPPASFRHDPVELIDQGFEGLIFCPRGRTAT